MKQFRNMVYPYVAWIAVMIVAPMLMIVLYAFTTAGNDVTTIRFTLDNFARFFSDQVFLDVLWRSLFIAVITTIICVLVGYPIAYAIAQRSEKSNMFWVLVITMPTWINMMVRTYAWVGILQDGGLINSLLGLFGIGPFKMMYTTFAVVLGMVYNFIPFMILQIHTSLTKMDKSYLEAAADLGANKVQSFLRVTARCSQRHHPGIPAGSIQLLYPQAAGRRSVCAHRQCHRNPVPHQRRLELRQCHLADYGGHHHDFHVYHPQGGYRPRCPRKGGLSICRNKNIPWLPSSCWA